MTGELTHLRDRGMKRCREKRRKDRQERRRGDGWEGRKENWAWCFVLIFPAMRWGKKDQKFKGILGYITS